MSHAYLVQILLPLKDNLGAPFDTGITSAINADLVETFGGATAFSRAPAKGTWINGDRKAVDDVIVVEVMTETLDREWWAGYRKKLEQRLAQQEIVIRAQSILRL